MKYSSNLNIERFENIRIKIIEFQLQRVKLPITILRILLLILGVLYIVITSRNVFGIQEILIMVLLMFIIIMTSEKGQVSLGKYRLRRLVNRYSASNVTIKYELMHENLEKTVILGNKSMTSSLKLDNIYNCRFLKEDNLIIFSNSKKINNLKNNRLKYITLDGLDELDKMRLVTMVKENILD